MPQFINVRIGAGAGAVHYECTGVGVGPDQIELRDVKSIGGADTTSWPTMTFDSSLPVSVDWRE